MASLKEYRRKRNFGATPEPTAPEEKVAPKKKASKSAAETGLPRFVVQRHAARRLHFDFRLEVNGALASWAVPKGPPEERGEKRLAVHVEDHPLGYASFEGKIPEGNYGAGEVQIWDEGTFQVDGPMSAADQIKRGDLKFELFGNRLKGRFGLVQMKRPEGGKDWLMIRKDDPPPASAEGFDGAVYVAFAKSSKIVDPAQLKGAIQTPMPAHVPVALATLSDKPFSNPNWMFEIKWDGERAIARIVEGDVEFWSRSGRNITAEYPELRELPKHLNARKAIVDGEIVVLDEAGRSDFSRIQPRFGVSNPNAALREKAPVTFYLFDFLYCDGYDLRPAALEDRKELLRALLSPSERIRYSDYFLENGLALYEAAREQGLEGIVAKQLGTPYPGRRTPLWLKLKLVQDMDVVIGGWTAPRRSREFFGALLMGLYDGDEFVHIGNVGTGFDHAMLERMHKSLQELQIAQRPFKSRPEVPGVVHWVKPEIVARVKYDRWTGDKKLRAPVFLGVQEDRSPRDCTFENQTRQEIAMPAKKAVRVEPKEVEKEKTSKKGGAERAPKKPATRVTSPPNGREAKSETPRSPEAQSLERLLADGKEDSLAVDLDGKPVKLTHLSKVFFKEPLFRKRDLLLHYLRVAPYILPFLKDRPLVLKRYPNGMDGKFFFQKDAKESHPDWIRTTMIESDVRGKEIPYFLADDAADLLYLTNLGCIDHNPWSSRYDNQDHPDYVFFDLDPTDGTGFDTVLTVARAVEKKLSELGVHYFMKTSGASGFHMFLPLEARYTYEQVRMFAGAIGQRVQQELPKLVTSERSVNKRQKGTVLIDALQNSRGKPLASVYSLRPFAHAPVSTPVTSRELAEGFRPQDFNIETIVPRLKKRGDLWADFWKQRQTLEAAVGRAN